MEIKKEDLLAFIKNALEEDVRDGDHTSLSTVPEDAVGKARLLVKDTGILAGVELAELIFRTLDPRLKTEVLMKDGDPIRP
ncbi:MAG: nicotinate-nucleotide diphosphorylase (carboxylating), partial [Leadbetterella sp.]|nr:nicotinate-nucleotide diphosphorylase (carboxylating) [Leadbetterella sp.]